MVTEKDYRKSDLVRLIRELELALEVEKTFPNVSPEQAVGATSINDPLRTEYLTSLNKDGSVPKNVKSLLVIGLRITRQLFLQFTSQQLSTDSYGSVATALATLRQL
jgi:hypothetical protein